MGHEKKAFALIGFLLVITIIVILGAMLIPSCSQRCEETAMARIPEFPWPPPQASSTIVIPSQFLVYSTDEIPRLRDIDERLSAAMEKCGYVEKRYYAVPDGFAVVTRLEQINSDGTPKDPPERWSMDVGPLRRFSLREYLRTLFSANPGYYRIIVFIITPHPFSQSEAKLSPDEAMYWLQDGLNVLPNSIGERVCTNEHNTTALIYEFKRLDEVDVEPNLIVPGRLTAQDHLKKSELWGSLER